MISDLSLGKKIVLIGFLRAIITLLILIPIIAIFSDVSGNKLTVVAIVLFAVVVIGEVLVTVIMQRTFQNSLNPVIEFSHHLSEGDFTTKLETIETRDALGHLVTAQNAMVASLSVII